MIRTDSAWHKHRKVKIGDYGEALVQSHVESKNFICYRPDTDGAHLCDFFILGKGIGTIAAEVKTKPMRDKYPDTGFNIRHYERYKQLSDEHNMRVFVFFVDEKLKWIYGNYLDVLDTPFYEDYGYPRNEVTDWGAIRYYHIDSMKLIRPLTDEELLTFKELRGSDKH